MDSYAKLLFPDRWVIGPWKMHVFSVGHAVLLQNMRSPFASLDLDAVASAGLGEVALAIMLCRRPWRKAERLVHTLRGRLLLRWYGIRISSGYGAAAISLFQYIEDAWTVPKTWRKPTAVVKSSPEHMLGNVISVLAETHHRRDEIYDMPLRLALYDVCQVLHSRGQIELLDEHDEDLLAEAAKMEREMMEQQNGA